MQLLQVVAWAVGSVFALIVAAFVFFLLFPRVINGSRFLSTFVKYMGHIT